MVDKQDDRFSVGIESLDEGRLPEGEVTLRVEWSSLNYKDGLACIPKGQVVRRYPMVPGIDLAGTVVESADARFKAGDGVFVTGYGTGVSHPGGFAEMARMPADWTLPLPKGLSAKEAMAIGTAGFTAALSIHELERNGLRPENGTVIVTGATGGVGSTTVAMLAQLGYTVAASTGKPDEAGFLRGLGATEILSREEVSAESPKPLESERWAGAVDPVGGATAAYLLRTTKYGGAVASSGLTGGTQVSTTVLPFILRGVSWLGIDSVLCPQALRRELWERLGADLKPKGLMESIVWETDLDGVQEAAARILKGEVRGRGVVRLG